MNAPKPKTIPIAPYKSQAINGFGYDPATRTLAIEWKSGGIHHYHDVPPEKHAEMQRATSIGGYIATQIKPHHQSSKP